MEHFIRDEWRSAVLLALAAGFFVGGLLGYLSN